MHMNLLQGTMDDCIRIDEVDYPIHTDFRRWIQLETVLTEPGDFMEKLPMLLALCYKELPPTIGKAIDGLLQFYIGAETEQGGQEKHCRPVYSFIQDEMLIYAAFYQQYGIDLSKASLHWWQFKALLYGLTAQTQLVRVMGYRAMDLHSLKNPEEKRFYKRMKALYKLKHIPEAPMREEDISAAIERLF